MNITHKDRFTRGDCHILAGAIHCMTGWPFCTFAHGAYPAVHAFVELPDGRFLDIEGISTAEEMSERWHEKDIYVWDTPQAAADAERGWDQTNVYWPASPKIAARIAFRLINAAAAELDLFPENATLDTKSSV